MVRVIGWTPSSRRENIAEVFLNEFHSPFLPDQERLQDYPMVRSGHRCFTDNDYYYVIGGYTNSFHDGAIFKELWAMSLATFEWRRYMISGQFPDCLASFSIVQLAPFSKTFLLFGGSGTNFGMTSSNKLYLMAIDNKDCTVHSRQLSTVGSVPRPIYGHAMCAGDTPGKYYIVGGTEGTVFHFEVHSLLLKRNPESKDDFVGSFELIAENDLHDGRYRLEATCDEENSRLLFFGGGNGTRVFGFDTVPCLDLKTNVTKEIKTIPDAIHGYPSARRCHAIARHNRTLVMTGGVGEAEENLLEAAKDVWIFNMDSFAWKKYSKELPEEVLFHDSAMTRDGWMLTFGGVHGTDRDSPRNNLLHGIWFDAPSLQRFAVETIRKINPRLFSGLYGGNLCPSYAIEIINAVVKPGIVEEKEKEIVMSEKIGFREDRERRRFYLNENATDFIVTHNRAHFLRARRMPPQRLVGPRPRLQGQDPDLVPPLRQLPIRNNEPLINMEEVNERARGINHQHDLRPAIGHFMIENRMEQDPIIIDGMDEYDVADRAHPQRPQINQLPEENIDIGIGGPIGFLQQEDPENAFEWEVVAENNDDN